MPRYFIEVSYKGTRYSGFQLQKNSNTIQAEIEKALEVLFKEKIFLTGSSRTDAGVHALQNYFHFDIPSLVGIWKKDDQFIYKINAILPEDIVVKNLIPVHDSSHSRFDAISREYKYFIYRKKNPFLKDRAFYFPYALDIKKMNLAAGEVLKYKDFTSFSKRNTQVKTFECIISQSEWIKENDSLIYHVKGNRFLRGMVRALTATMLKVGRGKITVDDFRSIIEGKDCTKASFSIPAHGLFLISVEYSGDYFSKQKLNG